MAALICIKRVRGTFCQLVNIANRFLRIFSNLETSIRFIFPGGAGYPYLPTRLIALCETDSIRYLGVMLSNNDSKHCEERVNATRRAYYALQNVGMCSRGVKPDTVVHIYNTAIRPVLMYGFQQNSDRQSRETPS